jgi:hypothetical protein
LESGGTGTTVLSAPITTTGTIVATSGSLDLAGVVSGSGLIQIDAGAVLEADGILTATGNLNITGSISGSGTISVAPGAALAFGTTGANTPTPYTGSIADVVDDGVFTIENGGSKLDISSAVDPSSSGYFLLTSQSTLEIAAYLGTALKIQFIGSSNKLTIDNAADFGLHVGTTSYAGPLLLGFGATDAVDLKGIASTGLVLNYSTTGDLQITNSAGTALATLAFQNSSLGAGTFHVASDGAGGTLLTHS